METRRGEVMKYAKFYREKLDMDLLERIDAEHKKKMRLLVSELESGDGTKKRKKRQKASILPNIALYKIFTENGISKKKAYELVKEYSFHIAKRNHNMLEKLFHIPGFFRVFGFFMRTGMEGDEIWTSKIIVDDSRKFHADVLKCLWCDTCAYFGCPELCEIFCLCDHIVFGDIAKLEFDRSQTLGMGGEKCDFRFRSKNGGES